MYSGTLGPKPEESLQGLWGLFLIGSLVTLVLEVEETELESKVYEAQERGEDKAGMRVGVQAGGPECEPRVHQWLQHRLGIC